MIPAVCSADRAATEMNGLMYPAVATADERNVLVS